MKSIFLGESGFFIEVPSATLVFDWTQGQLPRIRRDKPVYFFISHIHSDHCSSKAFKKAEGLSEVEIYLGYDNSIPNINKFLRGLPGSVSSHLHLVDGFKNLKSEDGRVTIQTLKSTDLGVAFLVEIDEETIFHAGDLYLKQAMNKKDYRKWQADMMINQPLTPVMDYESQFIHHNNEFFSYTEPLAGRIIDFGMIPLDPRVEGVAHKTLMRYLDIATFRSWSPMNLRGKYEFVDRFCKEFPELVPDMKAFAEPGGYEPDVDVAPETEEKQAKEPDATAKESSKEPPVKEPAKPEAEPEQSHEEKQAKEPDAAPEAEPAKEESIPAHESEEPGGYSGGIRHLETFDAWGPKDRQTFTWTRRAKFVTINSITDNPRIGDERNFVRIRDLNKKDMKLCDKVELEPGGLYEVAVWFFNDADPNSPESSTYVARDVKLRINQDRRVPRGYTSEIFGMVSASNSTPGRVWDKAYVHSNFDAVISMVERSAVIHSNGVCNGMVLSFDELLGDGALLGYSRQKMGELPAGGSFSGFVTYRFTATKG
ncbi:MAG: MBL fold metallo-hydrolase [Butyrivibrio sp.]|nr:MBL fold metallo-hydrolase [Butyrivibrio sp.]